MLGVNVSQKFKRIFEFIKICGDWILLIVLEGLSQFVGSRMPFAQMFYVLDPTISFPMASHEKVPDNVLYLYCFGIPAISVLVTVLVFGPGNLKRRIKLLNSGLLGVAASVVVAQIFTELVKFIVGRPRPDFLFRCQPNTAEVQAALEPTSITLFNSSICTTTNTATLADGFRSFPSGHSSMSFAGLTYLALYFSGRLRLFVPLSPHGKHIYSYLLAAAPLLVASFVASSRVSDYRHRGSDVLGGTVLGIFFGIIGYRYYFPWPQSQLAGVPWTIIRQEDLQEWSVSTRSVIRDRNSKTQIPLLPTTQDSTRLASGSRSAPTAHHDPDNPMELRTFPPAGAHSDQSHAA